MTYILLAILLLKQPAEILDSRVVDKNLSRDDCALRQDAAQIAANKSKQKPNVVVKFICVKEL